MASVPPPSEPDLRISRIRLSSRWSCPRGDWRSKGWVSPTSSEAPVWLLRQHPCRPVRRFAPLSSLSGHSPAVLARRAMLPVSFRMDRTSRLHLPAPLRSTGITRLQHYYGCSDSCAEARPRWPGVLLAEGGTLGSILLLEPRRSPRFTCSVPPEPSVSNHPAAPHDRFDT